MSSKTILVIDDEADIRSLITGILEDEGYETAQGGSDIEAFAQIEAVKPDLIVLDIWLQGSTQDGIEILQNIKKRYPEIPILMISGHGNIETAVHAMKLGAYDFIEKPFKVDRLILLVERALETASLRAENRALKTKAEPQLPDFIGQSHAIQTIRTLVDRVAQTNSRVLITGQAGTGKEVVARAIHRKSKRADAPFIALNCALMSPNHLEEELFGTETPLKEGVLERANGGTLLLDEVADMPLETQGKIVRVLQDQIFERVGGSKTIHADVRILASTNRDLQALLEKGGFRQDLFYRLNVVPIPMPALHERSVDILPLAELFMRQSAEINGLQPCRFGADAMAALQAYNWPGNVRQLKNMVEWLLIMKPGKTIRTEDLPPEIGGETAQVLQVQNGMEVLSLSLRDAREVFEKEYLMRQITRFGGNISKTASFIGMERSALHRKLKGLGVQAS